MTRLLSGKRDANPSSLIMSSMEELQSWRALEAIRIVRVYSILPLVPQSMIYLFFMYLLCDSSSGTGIDLQGRGRPLSRRSGPEPRAVHVRLDKKQVMAELP